MNLSAPWSLVLDSKLNLLIRLSTWVMSGYLTMTVFLFALHQMGFTSIKTVQFQATLFCSLNLLLWYNSSLTMPPVCLSSRSMWLSKASTISHECCFGFVLSILGRVDTWRKLSTENQFIGYCAII